MKKILLEQIKTFWLTIIACTVIILCWGINTVVGTPMPIYPTSIFYIAYIFIALVIDIFRASKDDD